MCVCVCVCVCVFQKQICCNISFDWDERPICIYLLQTTGISFGMGVGIT